MIRDERVKSVTAVSSPVVETAKPIHALLLAGGDPIQIVLQACSEVVVDELSEVLLEQSDDREGEERRHERRTLLEDVTAVDDRRENRRVRRRATDAPFLERLDERCLCEAGRWGGLVALGVERRERRVDRRL